MITEPNDYFTQACERCDRFATADCSTRAWIEGLEALRRICLDLGLAETVKWAHPCYMHAGRNIAVLGAFRGDFRLNFLNQAKQSATRVARIEAFRDRIIAGKGAQER